MVDSISNNQGAVALDINQLQNWLRGDTIVSGVSPSAGGSSLEVDVASGTARVGGSNVSVSPQTATLSSGGSNPRKDLVYIDSGGTVQVAQGTGASARPSGSVRFDTYQPAPPDSTGITGAVVASVWVAASKSGTFASADIRDRRILSAIDVDNIVATALANGGSPITVNDKLTLTADVEDNAGTPNTLIDESVPSWEAAVGATSAVPSVTADSAAITNGLAVDGLSAPTSGIAIKSGSKLFDNSSTTTPAYEPVVTNLADSGKDALSPNDDKFLGIAVVMSVPGDAVGLFRIDGDDNNVAKISGTANTTTTEDNDTTLNVYWDATNTRYEVNNELGGARNIRRSMIKIGV